VVRNLAFLALGSEFERLRGVDLDRGTGRAPCAVSTMKLKGHQDRVRVELPRCAPTCATRGGSTALRT
jgi:hypothetical protein